MGECIFLILADNSKISLSIVPTIWLHDNPYMLRAGCIILTIWALLNLILALYIVFSTTLWDIDSPAVGQILSQAEISSLTAKERTSINSVAVYANGLNIALSLTVTLTIWFGVYRGMKWAFISTCMGLGFAVIGGALGDYVLGTVHPEISLLSAAILIVGGVLAGVGIYGKSEHR